MSMEAVVESITQQLSLELICNKISDFLQSPAKKYEPTFSSKTELQDYRLKRLKEIRNSRESLKFELENAET